MKRKTLAGYVVAIVALLGVVSVPVLATSFNTGDDIAVAESDTVDGSYYGAGEMIKIKGTVNGDVFCGASSIEVSGTVRGDVICAGQTVVINGVVEGDVRAAGQTVVLGGEVKGSVTAFGMTVTMKESAKVGRDATIAGQSLLLDGTFARDVVISGQDVRIDAAIGRDATVQAELFSLADTTRVGGTLNYTTESRQEIGAPQVEGVVTYHEPSHEGQAASSSELLGAIAGTIATVAIGSALYALIAPRVAILSVWYGRRNLPLVILLGLAGVVGLPLLAVMLLVTVVLAPVAIVLLLVWVLLLLLSVPQVAAFLGNLILGKTSSNVLVQTLGGAMIIALLMIIPIVNIVAVIVITILGFGLGSYFIGHSVLGKPSYDYVSTQVKSKKE